MDDYGQVKHSRTLRHLEVCDSCQGWLQSLEQMGRHLRADSHYVSQLHMKRIQTIVHERLSDVTAGHFTTAGQKTHKSYRFRYAISAVAAVIVVAIGLFSVYSPESDKRDHNEMVDPVAMLSNQLKYQLPTLAVLPEQMLESEMENIETGIRHAVGFIQNCLPQGVLGPNLSSENADSQ